MKSRFSWMITCSLALAVGSAWAEALQSVPGFGTNPGNVRMYKHIPENAPENAPLVVVLHGCTQTAESYAKDTGFNDLADRLGFLVVYAEQDSKNNDFKCFNWFSSDDADRGRGEAASIAQMVEKMKADHSIDASKVFVTGVSAGGCMTANMMAAYPDVFAGGAVMAGIPRQCATDATEGMMCMFIPKDRSPQEWGNDVRDASPMSAQNSYPVIAVFHGTADDKVPVAYAGELMEQWTNVHQTDATPDIDEEFRGHRHRVYNDADGKPVAEVYLLEGMGHGIAVDPGSGPDEGGNEGEYAFNEGVWSSYYAAKFWGIIPTSGTAPPEQPSCMCPCPCE
jgi:poly(hydroxyalkanoate) depolymerase family esterase